MVSRSLHLMPIRCFVTVLVCFISFSVALTLPAAIQVQKGGSIAGEATGDRSGSSVSLSADGSTLAVGAEFNDGNGTDSGHVRVYDYNASAGEWLQRGGDIDGEAAGDWFGYSVSLSANSSTLAVGTNFNNGNGTESGHVRVYTYNAATGGWLQLGADIDGEAAGDGFGSSVSLSADGSAVAAGAMGLPYSENKGYFRVFSTYYSQSEVATAAEEARTIVNVSARVALGEGETVIPGFVVLGERKKMLIRAVGPKLADLGVASPLPDPTMTIYKSRFDGQPPDEIAIVDNWKENGADIELLNTVMATAGAFPLEPVADFQGNPLPTDDTKSAATLITLSTGVYTVVVTSADGRQGEVLVEVYEIIE